MVPLPGDQSPRELRTCALLGAAEASPPGPHAQWLGPTHHRAGCGWGRVGSSRFGASPDLVVLLGHHCGCVPTREPKGALGVGRRPARAHRLQSCLFPSAPRHTPAGDDPTGPHHALSRVVPSDAATAHILVSLASTAPLSYRAHWPVPAPRGPLSCIPSRIKGQEAPLVN